MAQVQNYIWCVFSQEDGSSALISVHSTESIKYKDNAIKRISNNLLRIPIMFIQNSVMHFQSIQIKYLK